MNTHWDAEVYERIGTPMRGWAQQVIDDLQLSGDEIVLDAGCGSGSVTLDLRTRLGDRGKIYAVDASEEMIASLARTIGDRSISNVIPVRASLTDFSLAEPVDCVFSNAVFHWIHDDDGLFGSLYRATKPGGRLRAQCGGAGNNARLLEAAAAVRRSPPFAEHLADIDDGKKYRTPGDARAALERAGWADARASLFKAPVPFERKEDGALYLRTIVLRDHVAHLPEDQRDTYAIAVAEEAVRRYGAPFVIDYVRLDLWARRPVGA